VLIKKIGGNWHKVEVWDNYAIGYKSGGIVIINLHSPDLKEFYIPFYNFSEFIIEEEGNLFIRDKENRIFQVNLNRLNRLHQPDDYSNDRIELTTVEAVSSTVLYKSFCEEKGGGIQPIYPEKGLLLEEPRAVGRDDRIIAVAYMQKGIDFFQTGTGEKIAHFDFPGYSFIDDIYLHNNKLYIADVFGLRILDISDVHHPVLDDRYTTCKGWAKDAAVYKHYLLVADVLGIKIFDKHRDFALTGKIESNRNRIAKVVVAGNYAFLSCEAVGLKVADLSDMENPRLISGIMLPKGIWDCAVYKGNAYLAAYTGGLLKVDCSDIKNLKQVGKYGGGEEVIGIHVTQWAVYAACSYKGFKILDHQLNLLSEVSGIEGRCWTILEYGGYVLAAAGKSGVLIYDAGQLEDPIPVNRIKTIEARDLFICDGMLYIADGSNGALVYDINDIHKIKYIRRIPSAAFTRGIMADEEYIYKTDGDGGVETYEQ